MEFKISQTLACSPEKYWDVVDSEGCIEHFEERADTELKVDREGVHKRLTYTSRGELPGIMKKALGIERMEYEEYHDVDKEHHRSTWEVETPFMSDRVKAWGTTRLESTDEGCRRVVQGRVEIKLAMVGAKMSEKFGQRLEMAHRVRGEVVEILLGE